MTIEVDILRAARRVFGQCRNCGGYVEFGLDEYRRATGTCVICGRENVQRVMTLAEVTRLTGTKGGNK